MATIVTPTTMTNAVRSIKGSSSTPSQAFQDLQAELGIGSIPGGATGGFSDVALATISSIKSLPGGANSSNPLVWDSVTNPTTNNFGTFQAGNTKFVFSKSVIALVTVGAGAYMQLPGPPNTGNIALHMYRGGTALFGSSSKWSGNISTLITEIGASLVWRFSAGEEVSIRLEINALDGMTPGSTSGYGSSPAGGSSFFSIAV